MSELSCFEVEFQFMFDKLAIKVGPIIFLEIRFDNTSKVTYPNYYKKYAYTLAHSMTFMCFCLFWPKKVDFKAKIESFLIFMLNNVFSR